jgi:hypothetical protein
MTTGTEHPVNWPLTRLVDAWCDRRQLDALAAILPAYTSNSGFTDGWAAVMESLRVLRANRGLPDEERAEIERLVALVETMVYRR